MSDCGKLKIFSHRLELIDDKLPPVCQPLRRQPQIYLDQIDRTVNAMLDANIITPIASSQWSTNVVLIHRKKTTK